MKKKLVVIATMLLLTIGLWAQRTISGKVVDSEFSEPIPGVNVLLKGTTEGTITDMNGMFSLLVPSDEAVIVASFIGYKSQEILVGTKATFNITLQADVTSLNEVVAVGYGVQQKRLVTGSTIQVKGDDIRKQSTVSPLTALQSQAPGVNITKTSGEPGAAFKVIVRGIGTVGNSNPIYVVDGMVVGNIDYLAPADIESFDVLKDAASAAIYGSRAANGVVLVTTKKGKQGKAAVTYDGFYGVQNVYKTLPLLNAQEYALIQNEAQVNSGLKAYDFASLMDPGDWEKIQNGTWKGTNWLKEMENPNAPVQSHAINITGGNDMSTYSIGSSYSSQEGIYGKPVQSNYEQFTFRVNSDHVLLKKNNRDIVKFGETVAYTYSERNGIGTGNMYWNDINGAAKVSPFLPLWAKDANGNEMVGTYHYAIPWNTNQANPIGAMVYQRGYNLSKNDNLRVNAYLEIEPIKGLKWRSAFGFNQSGNTYRSYSPVYELAPNSKRTEDQTTQNMGKGHGWIFDNTLTYKFSVAEKHNFNVMAGTSAEKYGIGENLGVTNLNNVFDDFDHAYIDNANDPIKAAISGAPWRAGQILSYFGRINYDYKETYMLTLIMRADGSSNFDSGYRWANFPSVSGGWVVTNEPFMESISDVMDFLKLRASWGQNGNQTVDPFLYLSNIAYSSSTNPSNYYFGDTKNTVSKGAYPSNIPAPDLSWETSQQANIGLDARFLKSRLNLALDFYNKKTKDWLLSVPVPSDWGVSTVPANAGDVVNKGVEVGLGWNDNINTFKYGVNANLSYNNNEVVRLDNGQGIINATDVKLWGNGPSIARAEVGHSLGYFWGYSTAGIFQNEEQIANYKNSAGKVIMPTAVPGDVIYVDRNDDGAIDDKDKHDIGSSHPDFLFAFNFNCEFKGFDLSVNTNGAMGGEIARSWHDAGGPLDNYTTAILKRWHGEGTSNRIPRVTNGSHINQQYTKDIDLESGDFYRISNVTLGYDVKKVLPKLPLGQLRVYCSVQNLYTFTGYSGQDPEIGTSTSTDTRWVSGVDLGFYPLPRTYLIGANIKF
jgi:TonB-dependent starch-binding outer membrane protein SusC